MKLTPAARKFAENALRRASVRWPPRNIARNLVKVARGEYKCAATGHIIRYKDIQHDHIIPVVAVEGRGSLDEFAARLFVGVRGYQILCREHHKQKSITENAQRSKRKKK